MIGAEQPTEVRPAPPRRVWLRVLLSVIAIVLIAAWFVPRISADRYREPVRAALERALGRRVDFSGLKFRLLPLPGFTITNLIVSEDPSVGAEPVAYVRLLSALPRIGSLFTGSLGLSSVDLEDASITLTRVEHPNSGVRWNFASLVRPARTPEFPSVHMRSGRINFKFGDTKSIFYLLDTDVDLWPPASNAGSWTVRVHAQPARTDRPARGFGFFSARGQWMPRDNSITLDVRLEQSEVGDILTLFEGHESGLLGQIHGDAHLAGPMNRVGVRGRLTIENIHGWNQSPPGGNAWPVWLSGYVDPSGQLIELRAEVAQSDSPVDIRYRVANYLAQPQWGVTALFRNMPVAPIAVIARNLGARIPADFTISGTADGAASYAMPNGSPRLDGQIALSNLTVSTGAASALRLEPASVKLSGTSVELEPSALSNSAGEKATLSANWDVARGAGSASIATSGMSILALRRQISAAGIPVLSQATGGDWSGTLQWSDGWRGNVRITNADIPFEAFSEPLHVRSAEASVDGDQIVAHRVDVSAAGIEASGDYRYEPGAVRPHRFRLNIAHADAAALERLFSPALRRAGFLNYAFNFGRAPQPGWLTAMRADGVIQANEIDLGGAAAKKLHARVIWDGALVRLADVQSTIAGGKLAGAVTIDLSQREPRYEIPGAIAGMPWRSGALDAEGEATTHGFGADLLVNLRAKGSFHGRSVELGSGENWDTANGCFEWAARDSRLKLTQLALTTAGETWLGTAEMQANGALVLDLSDGDRKMQLTEALFGTAGTHPGTP